MTTDFHDIRFWKDRARYKHEGLPGKSVQIVRWSFIELELLRMVAVGWQGGTHRDLVYNEYPFLRDWNPIPPNTWQRYQEFDSMCPEVSSSGKVRRSRRLVKTHVVVIYNLTLLRMIKPAGVSNSQWSHPRTCINMAKKLIKELQNLRPDKVIKKPPITSDFPGVPSASTNAPPAERARKED